MSWINKLTNRTISRDPVLEKLDGKIFKPLSEAEKSQIQDKDDLFYPDSGQTLHTLSRAGAVALIDNEWKEFIGSPDSPDTAEEFKSNLNKLSNHTGVKYFVNNCISQIGFTQAGLTYFNNSLINNGYKCDFEETRTIMVPLTDGRVAIRVILNGYKLVKMPTSIGMFGDPENIQSNISLIESKDNKPLITFDTTYLIFPHKDDSARLTVHNHYQIIHDERINKYLPKFKPSLFQRFINYLENNPIKTVLSILAGAGLVAGVIFLAPIVLPAIGIGATFAAAALTFVGTLTGSILAGSAVVLVGVIGGLVSAIFKKIVSTPYQPPKILSIPSYHNLAMSLKKGLENYLVTYNLKSGCSESYQNIELSNKIDKDLSIALDAVKSIVNTLNEISDERSDLLKLDKSIFDEAVSLQVTLLETYLKQLQLAIASLKNVDAQNAELKILMVQAKQLETAVDKQFMKAIGRSMQEFQGSADINESEGNGLLQTNSASKTSNSIAKISVAINNGNAVTQSNVSANATSTKIFPQIFTQKSHGDINEKPYLIGQSNYQSASSKSSTQIIDKNEKSLFL